MVQYINIIVLYVCLLQRKPILTVFISFLQHAHIIEYQFYPPHPPTTNILSTLKLIREKTYLKTNEVNIGTVKPRRNEGNNGLNLQVQL